MSPPRGPLLLRLRQCLSTSLLLRLLCRSLRSSVPVGTHRSGRPVFSTTHLTGTHMCACAARRWCALSDTGLESTARTAVANAPAVNVKHRVRTSLKPDQMMLDFTHTPAEHMDSLEQENDLSLGAPLGLSHSSPGSWRRVRWALQGHHARERLAIIIVDLLALGRINADMIERPILAPDIARETIVRVGRVYAKLPLASIIRSLVSFPGLDTDMIIRIDLTPDIAILTEGIGGRDHLELDRPLAGGILAGCHIDGIDLMRLDREFERRQALRGGWVKSRRQHLGEGTHVIGRQRDPV